MKIISGRKWKVSLLTTQCLERIITSCRSKCRFFHNPDNFPRQCETQTPLRAFHFSGKRQEVSEKRSPAISKDEITKFVAPAD